MGLYVRPNSPYWWATIDGTGTRVSLKIRVEGPTPEDTKANKLLAQRAYHALLGDVAREKFDLPSGREPVTFLAFSRWYEAHHTAHHRGARQERSVLKNLRKGFGAFALHTITPARWQEYATRRMKEGVIASTVGQELGAMKRILNAAIGEHLEWSPLSTVKRKRSRLPAKRTVTAKEEPAFLRALRRRDAEIADMYLVAVGTLLRQENLIELRRADHRGDRLALNTKTGPHQVPLAGPTPLQRRAGTVLNRRLPKEHGGYFFARWRARFHRTDNPGTAREQFLKVVRAAAADARIPWGLDNGGIVWHTATRATGATRMLRDYRVDLRTVQLIGNWASLDQMAEYLGIDPQHFDRVRW